MQTRQYFQQRPNVLGSLRVTITYSTYFVFENRKRSVYRCFCNQRPTLLWRGMLESQVTKKGGVNTLTVCK